MLELLFYKRISKILTGEIEITEDNIKYIVMPPIIKENLSINEIDRYIKDIIDELISQLGFNDTLIELKQIKIRILELSGNYNCNLFLIALYTLSERIMEYYEGIIYPKILKWLLRVKNNNFNKEGFLKDLTTSTTEDQKILGIDAKDNKNQISLEGFEDREISLDDLTYAIYTKNKNKNMAISLALSSMSREEISDYSKVLFSALKDTKDESMQVIAKCIFNFLNEDHKFNKKKSKTEKSSTRQLKIPGF